MSSTQSIHLVGGEGQNSWKLHGVAPPPVLREIGPKPCDPVIQFIQDIELKACEKINTMAFRRDGGVCYAPKLTPNMLTLPERSQPFAVVRHMASFAARHHPFAGGHFSYTVLGRRYRRDHTSIISGVSRMRGLIENRSIYAFHLQKICDDLESEYGPLCIWSACGMSRPEEDRAVGALTYQEIVRRRERESRERLKRTREIYLMTERGVSRAIIGKRFGITKQAVSSARLRVRSKPELYGVTL